MKSIMYHYVRPDSGGMPYFRYLSLDDFRRQLDHLGNEFGFVSQEDFLESFSTGRTPKGVVLTFDDGFSDHYCHVMPELLDRGLWGIFYIPVGMYHTGKLLDVHRIHVLLGTHGGAKILAALIEVASDDMLSHGHVDEFHSLTYTKQDNDSATTTAKRILNYFISYKHRDVILDKLMERFIGEEANFSQEFYIDPSHIRKMQDCGMIIGSHSFSHPVFSKLEVADQRQEIETSFQFLEELTGGLKVRNFCYPYGGFHSFTDDTESILNEVGCRFSFNVEHRDIVSSDLINRPQALPRFDCNLFPFGKAQMGDLP